MSELLWLRAAKLLGLSPDNGWPNSLSLKQIAILQYPDRGADVRKQRSEMVAAMEKSIASGSLESVTRDELFPEHSPTQFYGNGEGRKLFNGREFVYVVGEPGNGPIVTQSLGVKTVQIVEIERDAFSTWWARQKEQSSPYLESWFDVKASKTIGPDANGGKGGYRAGADKTNAPYRDAEEKSVEIAKGEWDEWSQSDADRDPVIRMGEMVTAIRKRLKNEGAMVPKEETIRGYLTKAANQGKLAIPEEARAPGRKKSP